MTKLLVGVVALALAIVPVSGALADNWTENPVGPNGERHVVVCKYVGERYVDEQLHAVVAVLARDVAVDYGFRSEFPLEFRDDQGQSIVVRWTTGDDYGSLEDCPEPRTLTPIAFANGECIWQTIGVVNVGVGISSDEDAEGYRVPVSLDFDIVVGEAERSVTVFAGEADVVESFADLEGSAHVVVSVGEETVLDTHVTLECDKPEPPKGSGDNPPVPTNEPIPDEPDVVVLAGDSSAALPFTGNGLGLAVWAAAALALIALGVTFLRRSV